MKEHITIKASTSGLEKSSQSLDGGKEISGKRCRQLGYFTAIQISPGLLLLRSGNLTALIVYAYLQLLISKYVTLGM